MVVEVRVCGAVARKVSMASSSLVCTLREVVVSLLLRTACQLYRLMHAENFSKITSGSGGWGAAGAVCTLRVHGGPA